MKEAVDEVCNAKVAKLLALIGNIIVLDAKSTGNGSMLDSCSNEDRQGAGGDLANQVPGRHGGSLLAVGLDFDDCEEVVVLDEGMIHGIADTGVEYQS